MKYIQERNYLFVIKTFFYAVLIALAIFIFMLPAIRNGYPLLYSDSASYICSGHDESVPIDRPIVYGLLVRHISMSFSLWFVVFFQAAAAVLLIWLSLHLFVKKERVVMYTFILGTVTGLLTGASNYTSQIMPDIFSAYMIWSVALLFVSREKKFQWICWTLAMISALVHYSNLMTLSVFSLLLLILLFVMKSRAMAVRRLALQLSMLMILPWGLMLSINYAFEKEVFINRSTPVFMTGRLIETGLMKTYLTDYPEAENFSLYPYRKHLPEKAWQFIWNDDSPLYNDSCMAEGWGNCWLVHAGEYKRMIRSMLKKPELLTRFIRISMADWMKQLTVFDIGHLNKQGAHSAFNEIITRYFEDAPLFKRSGQFNEDLFFRKESRIQNIFVILSIILIGALLWKFKRIRKGKLILFLLSIGSGIILNALFCSVFSGVLNRYQGRVIWLLPWMAAFLIIYLIENRCFHIGPAR